MEAQRALGRRRRGAARPEVGAWQHSSSSSAKAQRALLSSTPVDKSRGAARCRFGEVVSLLSDMVAAGRQPNLNTYRIIINACEFTDQAGLAFQVRGRGWRPAGGRREAGALGWDGWDRRVG